MKHKTIQQLRDNLKKVLKRARPKQLKKLRKAYHGKRLKKWWSDYANADGCNTISELKDFEGAGHRMKGGHTHNHARNVKIRRTHEEHRGQKCNENERVHRFHRIFAIHYSKTHCTYKKEQANTAVPVHGFVWQRQAASLPF